MSKWRQSQQQPACIVDDHNERVASCYSVEHAAQIVREHNSHEALLEACKVAHKHIDTGWCDSDDADYRTILAAIKLAGDKP